MDGFERAATAVAATAKGSIAERFSDDDDDDDDEASSTSPALASSPPPKERIDTFPSLRCHPTLPTYGNADGVEHANALLHPLPASTAEFALKPATHRELVAAGHFLSDRAVDTTESGFRRRAYREQEASGEGQWQAQLEDRAAAETAINTFCNEQGTPQTRLKPTPERTEQINAFYRSLLLQMVSKISKNSDERGAEEGGAGDAASPPDRDEASCESSEV